MNKLSALGILLVILGSIVGGSIFLDYQRSKMDTFSIDEPYEWHSGSMGSLLNDMVKYSDKILAITDQAYIVKDISGCSYSYELSDFYGGDIFSISRFYYNEYLITFDYDGVPDEKKTSYSYDIQNDSTVNYTRSMLTSIDFSRSTNNGTSDQLLCNYIKNDALVIEISFIFKDGFNPKVIILENYVSIEFSQVESYSSNQYSYSSGASQYVYPFFYTEYNVNLTSYQLYTQSLVSQYS